MVDFFNRKYVLLRVSTWILAIFLADNLLFLFDYCHFFCASKRSDQEKESGNDNFSLFWQNAFGVTRPKKAEVHTI